jgi:ATP-dependent Clp protease protease subunit
MPDIKQNEFHSSSQQDHIDLTLHKHGIYYLSGEIDEISIQSVVKWILAANAEGKTDKLTLMINSVGGDLYSAFALIDIMRTSKLPIYTVGTGSLMSAAFLIFISAEKGRRSITKNTSVMCHQFSTYYEGKEHDVKSSEKETRNIKQRMLDIIKDSCDMDEKAIRRKLLPPSDVWLTAEECIELGVADAIF